MKTYYYRLNDEPFESIKSGMKKIEMRLYDEKRQLLRCGDEIVFVKRDDTGSQITTRVIGLQKFKNFEELYSHFDKRVLGYHADDNASPDDMSKYYEKSEIDKFGVVGIEIELINNL